MYTYRDSIKKPINHTINRIFVKFYDVLKVIDLKRGNNMKRLLYIDAIKCYAIIMVLITHSLSSRPHIFLQLGGPFLIDIAVPLFLIVTGYNYSNSCKKHKMNSYKEWFTVRNLIKINQRILFPFMIIAIIEWLIIFIKFGDICLVNQFLFNTITFGPGFYYILLLLIIQFTFPFILALYKRNAKLCIMLSIIVNIIFEFANASGCISDWTYRISLARQITFIIAGIYLSYTPIYLINKNYIIIGTIISNLIILNVNYLDYAPLIYKGWINTSSINTFYVISIFICAKRLIYSMKNKYIENIIGIISMSSYHIFLIQMVYFGIGLGYMTVNYNLFIGILLNIFLCVFIGYLSYKIEMMFKKKLKNTNSRN